MVECGKCFVLVHNDVIMLLFYNIFMHRLMMLRTYMYLGLELCLIHLVVKIITITLLLSIVNTSEGIETRNVKTLELVAHFNTSRNL